MAKHVHEIRDPIHTFVRLDSTEREVLDSRPFQRLRHIHQLALTHLVYPGATHRRFEHSLGVMELASRVFDVVTDRANVMEEIRQFLHELDTPDELARYFMYSQVYFHPVRRIYDIHLKDFLKEWLVDGEFSIDPEAHLKMTDNEVAAGLAESVAEQSPGHVHARRIVERQHFKVVYERNPDDVRVNPEAGRAVYDSLVSEFGGDDRKKVIQPHREADGG